MLRQNREMANSAKKSLANIGSLSLFCIWPASLGNDIDWPK